MQPEGLDKGVHICVGASERDACPYDIIHSGGNDAPGEGVLTPGGECIGVQFLDFGPGAVVFATAEMVCQ